MSKNIVIQEGGTGKSLTVDKLRTNLSEGGTCLWVPEDEVGVTTMHISENGTYTAADDGYHGYSVVYVNVPGGPGGPASDTPGSVIVGTDPEDGEEYAYETVDDGEGGTEVKKTLMPSGIAVTTPPTKTNYTKGEIIDYAGIVVKLKKANGDFYTDSNYVDSVIPFAELTFPKSKAEGGGDGEGTFADDTLGQYGFSSPLYLSKAVHFSDPGSAAASPVPKLYGDGYGRYFSEAIFTGMCARGPCTFYLQSKEPISVAARVFGTNYTPASGERYYYLVLPTGAANREIRFIWVYGDGDWDFNWFSFSADPGYLAHYTKDSKTVSVGFYGITPNSGIADVVPDLTLSSQTGWSRNNVLQAAWLVCYGENAPISGKEAVPVQWTPPVSKFPAQKTRSTTFEITVTAGNGGTTVDDDGFSGNEGNF